MTGLIGIDPGASGATALIARHGLAVLAQEVAA